VIGDLASPVGPLDRDAPRAQSRGAAEQVFIAGVATQRDDRRMLEEKKLLLPGAFLDGAGAAFLQGGRRRVADPPQEPMLAFAARRGDGIGSARGRRLASRDQRTDPPPGCS
jgi:hypothetical protein